MTIIYTFLKLNKQEQVFLLMYSVCVPIWSVMYSLECSLSCSIDHSFDFFYFVLFSSGTKGLDTLTFLETLKVRIFNYALQISDYNAHNLLLCRKYSLTMFFHHWSSVVVGYSDFYLCL